MFSSYLLDIDHLNYVDALDLMRGLVNIKIGTGHPEIIIMLEHDPVFTMGRRSEDSEILVSRECLEEHGISVHRIERGGLITYHGPGQLVAYVIFDLNRMRLGVSELVHGLEGVILDTLEDFGIRADRKDGYRGVWVGNEKIASIGIAVRKGITFHGLALNYDPDFAHFEMINPCGIDGVKMTSLNQLLQTSIRPAQLREAMARHFSHRFDLALKPWSIDRARKFIRKTDSGD